MTWLDVVSDNIRARRNKLGLTQTQAAQRIKRGQSWWRDMEAGCKSFTLLRIAAAAMALDCTVIDLLTVKEQAK